MAAAKASIRAVNRRAPGAWSGQPPNRAHSRSPCKDVNQAAEDEQSADDPCDQQSGLTDLSLLGIPHPRSARDTRAP